MQEGAVKATIDLAPEIADVDIDDIGITKEVKVPDVLGNLRAGEHVPGMAHEIFQEGELPRAQFDQAPAAADLALGGVHSEVPEVQQRIHLQGRPAQQGPETGHQLREGKGFDQIIVGPDIETPDAIFYSVLGGEQQDGALDTPVPQHPQDVQAVQLRQENVEH